MRENGSVILYMLWVGVKMQVTFKQEDIIQLEKNCFPVIIVKVTRSTQSLEYQADISHVDPCDIRGWFERKTGDNLSQYRLLSRNIIWTDFGEE